MAYPGTLSLSPATVIALWTEIGVCVARAGALKRLLLLNGHGGNVAVMDIVARELRQHHGLLGVQQQLVQPAPAARRCRPCSGRGAALWHPRRAVKPR